MRVHLGDDDNVEVAMAPLIDCVFLLLIFFLVATTLKKIDDELPLTLPESSATIAVQQPDDVTIVAIDQTGVFHFNGSPVNTDLLHRELRDLGRIDRNAKIRLDIDRAVPFQRVMEVLDMLRFEQLANIGVNTNQNHLSNP